MTGFFTYRNNVRLLGTNFSNNRIVKKILAIVPEKFESTIASLENSRDLSSINLEKLVNALQVQEQIRLLRQEGYVEGVFWAKNYKANKYNQNSNTHVFLPYPYCKKNNHPHNKCWWRIDTKCHKRGQLGHVDWICKSKPKEAKVIVEEQEDEQLFVATCFATSSSSNDSWLIDNDCTNHMTNDQKLFQGACQKHHFQRKNWKWWFHLIQGKMDCFYWNLERFEIYLWYLICT